MLAHRFRRTILIVAAVHLLACWILAGMPGAKTRDAAVPRGGVRWIDARPRPGAASGLMATGARAAPLAGPHVAPARPLRSPSAQAAADATAASATTYRPKVPARARPSAVAAATPRVRRGEVRATGAAMRDVPPWPVYPTRAPVSMALHYAVVQGGGKTPDALGDARLEWRREGSAFDLRLAVALPGRPPREWESVGGFDAAGLAPARLVERERGRDKRAVNLDQVARQVRFSGAVQARALAAGAQDRWSWIAQLAAIAEARAPIPPGTSWTLQVAGLRGDLDRWTFRVLAEDDTPQAGPLDRAWPRGNDALSPPVRASPLLHVVREPERPYDLRIEAWLSPSLHHLPIGLRMSTPPGNWSLALWQGANDADPQGGATSASRVPPDATVQPGADRP